jgi:hypothetical protein
MMTYWLLYLLTLQLMEGYQLNSLQLNPSAEDVEYARQQAQPQGDGFFHALECEPTLQIGYVWSLKSNPYCFVTFRLDT